MGVENEQGASVRARADGCVPLTLRMSTYHTITYNTGSPERASSCLDFRFSKPLKMLTDITAWLEIELYPYNTVLFGPIWYDIQRLTG